MFMSVPSHLNCSRGRHLRGEVVHSHDATFAGLGWEVWALGEAGVLVLQTHEAKTWVFLRVFYRVGCRRTYSHSEALSGLVVCYMCRSMTDLGKSSNLLVTIPIEVLLCVVDGCEEVDTQSVCVSLASSRLELTHATVDTVRQSAVLHDRHSLIRAVGVFEEHRGGPVIAISISFSWKT